MRKKIATIIALFIAFILQAQTVVEEVSLNNGNTIIVYSNGTRKEKVFKNPAFEWASIPADTFTMGIPTSEVDRSSDETQL